MTALQIWHLHIMMPLLLSPLELISSPSKLADFKSCISRPQDSFFLQIPVYIWDKILDNNNSVDQALLCRPWSGVASRTGAVACVPQSTIAWSSSRAMSPPDMRALLAADVIVATPEKWAGVLRAWQRRGYVQRVALLILDRIHQLGADR